jgi:hypothetical protein
MREPGVTRGGLAGRKLAVGSQDLSAADADTFRALALVTAAVPAW